MNKIFGILCAGSIALIATSCGGNKAAENDSLNSDSVITAVEEVVEIDSLSPDSAAVTEMTAVEEVAAPAAEAAGAGKGESREIVVGESGVTRV